MIGPGLPPGEKLQRQRITSPAREPDPALRRSPADELNGADHGLHPREDEWVAAAAAATEAEEDFSLQHAAKELLPAPCGEVFLWSLGKLLEVSIPRQTNLRGVI